mmetsp:Transcript_22849/g.70919  ORF Transcript_22849/g.70919 Transcript_22849/m.70919 type:complete len:349 (+) Transcript_22849:445-1491(+)
MSHLGRPKGQRKPEMSLAPVADRLRELLGENAEVAFVEDCVGDDVTAAVGALTPGSVLVLQNLRYHAAEEKNEEAFATQLASLADVYVNDAFGTAHRAHASTVGVPTILGADCCATGKLMEKELAFLRLDEAERPLAAIIGGAKVSSKLPVITALVEKVNILVLGGGLAFTFLKAQGKDVGASLVEDDLIATASGIITKAEELGVTLIVPTDVIAAAEFKADAENEVISFADGGGIREGWMGLDAGPATVAAIADTLATAKTIIWNGPLGVFEFDAFAQGTLAIATKLAELTGAGCTSIVGGGDSVAAVEKMGVASEMSHVSTGGGATLELLGGATLPGVAAIADLSA